MSKRDRVKDKADIGHETVSVPQWEETFDVRSMKVGPLTRLLKRMPTGEDGGVDIEQLYPNLVIACTYDDEAATETTFSTDDFFWLVDKNGAAMNLLAMAAVRVCGLSAEAVKEQKKVSS